MIDTDAKADSMDVDEVPSVEDTEENKEDERVTEESSQEPTPTVENGDSKPVNLIVKVALYVGPSSFHPR